MCGLVGVFSKYASGFTHELNDVFSTLLLVDTLRGEDSTGAFLVRMNGDLDLVKEASTAGQFLKSKEWKDLRSAAYTNGACLIGHNRKATRGNVNDENAHPFVVDDKIVLVHNGTMYGDHKKHADVEVDSHAIAHLLEEHGDPSIALGKFHGAYALIWYDVEKEEVNLIRNDQRPLYWMEIDNAWIWASERDFLLFTASRMNLKIKNGPVLLEPESLQKFALRNRKWEVSYEKLEIKQDFSSGTGAVGGVETVPTEKEIEEARNEWNERFARARAAAVAASFDDDCCAFDTDNKELPKTSLDENFPVTIGGNKWEKTSQFEKHLAETCNRSVTSPVFHREIVPQYGWGKEVICTAFEYVDDGCGGWFLYASPDDDPQVIFRHHFHYTSKVEEERIMRMALNGYKFKFEVNTKSWAPFSGFKNHPPEEEGYCIITTRKATIVDGGGVKEKSLAC